MSTCVNFNFIKKLKDHYCYNFYCYSLNVKFNIMHRFRHLSSLSGNTIASGKIICTDKLDPMSNLELEYKKNNTPSFGVGWHAFDVKTKTIMCDHEENCLQRSFNYGSMSVSKFEQLLCELEKTHNLKIESQQPTVIYREYTEVASGGERPVWSSLSYSMNLDGTYNICYTYETYYYEFSDGMYPVLSDYVEHDITKEELDNWIKIANGQQ